MKEEEEEEDEGGGGGGGGRVGRSVWKMKKGRRMVHKRP